MDTFWWIIAVVFFVTGTLLSLGAAVRFRRLYVICSKHGLAQLEDQLEAAKSHQQDATAAYKSAVQALASLIIVDLAAKGMYQEHLVTMSLGPVMKYFERLSDPRSRELLLTIGEQLPYQFMLRYEGEGLNATLQVTNTLVSEVIGTSSQPSS